MDMDTSTKSNATTVTVEELQLLQHKDESDIILHLQCNIHALENTLADKTLKINYGKSGFRIYKMTTVYSSKYPKIYRISRRILGRVWKSVQ